MPVEEPADGIFDLALREQRHTIDARSEDFERKSPDASFDPPGRSLDRGEPRHGRTSLEGEREPGRAFVLASDDRRRGIVLPGEVREAAGESAAPDGKQERFRLGEVLEDFRGDRSAVGGHHVDVVEGGQETFALAGRDLDGPVLGLVVARELGDPDLRPAGADAGELGRVDRAGDADGRRDAATPRGFRDRLAVVSGRAGDDAARAVGSGETLDLERRAADLEGPRSLKALELQPDRDPRALRELRRVEQGRGKNPAAEEIRGRGDQRKRELGYGRAPAGAIGSGVGLWIGGIVRRYAYTAFRSSSVIFA